NVLGPLIELEPLLGNPARPQAIDEHAIAVRRRLVVDAGDANVLRRLAPSTGGRGSPLTHTTPTLPTFTQLQRPKPVVMTDVWVPERLRLVRLRGDHLQSARWRTSCRDSWRVLTIGRSALSRGTPTARRR